MRNLLNSGKALNTKFNGSTEKFGLGGAGFLIGFLKSYGVVATQFQNQLKL